jgi:hypothetical protein
LPTDAPDPQAVGDRIEQLLARLRSRTDDGTYAAVEELVRLLTELYGAGLALAVQLGGADLADGLAADDLGASLLLLHGLHPHDLGGRVQRAVDDLAPRLAKGGVTVELDPVDGSDVRVVVRAAGGCGSTTEALRGVVADAVWSAAPDARSVAVELASDDSQPATPVRFGPTRVGAAGRPTP